jgi:hypothetical protein
MSSIKRVSVGEIILIDSNCSKKEACELFLEEGIGFYWDGNLSIMIDGSEKNITSLSDDEVLAIFIERTSELPDKIMNIISKEEAREIVKNGKYELKLYL